MRKTIFYCDRCGKEVPGIVRQIGVRDLDQESGFETERNWGAELCGDCYMELMEMTNWLLEHKSVHFSEGIPKQDPEVQKEPEKPRHPKAEKIHEARVRGGRKGKLDLDLGKIGALYRTNRWSIKDIASDMKCSEQTIRNHLQEALDYYDKKIAEEDL